MMTEYIDREAFIDREAVLNILASKNAPWDGYQKVADLRIADVVSKAAYDQVAWERNLAEEQLKSIGKSLGEKMDDVQPVKWIPVAERLPEEKGNYLVVQDCGHGSEVHEAFFFKYFDSWEWYDPVEEYQKYNPSHWMPLPKPPEDGEV